MRKTEGNGNDGEEEGKGGGLGDEMREITGEMKDGRSQDGEVKTLENSR